MSYAEFTLSTLTKQFGLTIIETEDLFSSVAASGIRDPIRTSLAEGVSLALAIATEKARSELIIAPLLLELWRLKDRQIGLFSGVEFSVDTAAGLAGTCDFILTRAPEQLFISAPVVMLVEAKNEDMKRGYAQCLAEMIAAQRFNEREGAGEDDIWGVVTTGNNWRFLRLHDSTAWIDKREYYIDRPGKIMGILLHLLA